MLYYFKKGKDATETQKKRFVQRCGEGAVTIERVKGGLRSFMLEISWWTCCMIGRPVEVESHQIETLFENNQCYTKWR